MHGNGRYKFNIFGENRLTFLSSCEMINPNCVTGEMIVSPILSDSPLSESRERWRIIEPVCTIYQLLSDKKY